MKKWQYIISLLFIFSLSAYVGYFIGYDNGYPVGEKRGFSRGVGYGLSKVSESKIIRGRVVISSGEFNNSSVIIWNEPCSMFEIGGEGVTISNLAITVMNR